jgi:WD40 repeat protein
MSIRVPGTGWGGQDGSADPLWDVTDRQRPVVAARIANGHETVAVEAMALTTNGASTLLVSAGREGKLVLSAFDDLNHAHELGEIQTAGRIQTRADSAALLTLTISRDGRTLAAAGKDGPIGLWDIVDPSRPRQIGAPLLELRGQVYGVGVLSDGLTLVAGGDDERIAAWDLRPIAELRHTAIATACCRSGAAPRSERVGPPCAGAGVPEHLHQLTASVRRANDVVMELKDNQSSARPGASAG